MIGILCEKPSAARNFAKALGGPKGTYNGEQYIITNTIGHVFGYITPDKQVSPALSAKYKSWDLDNLPWNEKDIKWEKVKKKDTSSILATIKTVLSPCDEIVIATDVDPTGEGELLAWEILDALKFRPKKWSRMYFTDEAVPSIQKAFVSRKPLKDMLSDMDYVKANYRSQWDFMSMQFTRIAKKCGDGKSMLRQGRLKSAMVVITGDGLKAYKSYKKIPSYSNRFRDENGNMFSSVDEPEFSDKTKVPKSYTDSKVIVDSKEIKHTAPPSLLDIASLSAILSTKGIKADTVLKTYQKMYEKQVVSYPRTEDKCVTPEQFNDLLPLIDDIANLVGINPSNLTHRQPRNTHVKTGGAHGANRPGPNVPKSLDTLDSEFGTGASMIYEILAKNYLTILAEDYEYEFQKGHLEKYPKFLGTSSVPKKMGYKAIFDNEDDDSIIEDGKGLGTLAKPFVYEGFPPKPPVPTMKWLMKQLEKRDVGTGATRTNIYADVTNQNTDYPLLVEKRGKLSMSEYGDMSYLLLKDTHIGDLSTTEQLMKDMRDIAKGLLNPDECLHKIQKLVIDDIETMKKNGFIMRKELNVMEQTTEKKEKFDGIWNGKEISFTREWGGHRFTDDECEELLEGNEIKIEDLVNASGVTYGVIGKLSEQSFKGHKFVGFERTSFISDGKDHGSSADKYQGTWKNKKVSFKREYCGYKFSDAECEALCDGKEIEILGLVSKSTGKTYGVTGKLAKLNYNGHDYIGFDRIGFAGGNKGVPDEWCKHKFTDDEKVMLEAGKSISLDGCVSKKGNIFSCKVKYGKNDKGFMGIIPEF